MNVLELFKPINTFVFDVDGVLTNGSLLIMPNGLLGRLMNIKDSYALEIAVKKGYRVIIISGGDISLVRERLNKLGIKDVLMGIENKMECLRQLMTDYKIRKEHVLYMGDDIPDLNAMKYVGLPCCPTDSVNEIKEIAKYISPFKGGEGCGRDVIEKVLKLRGNWNSDPGIKIH